MGEVFRPDDILKGRKKLVEEALRDLSPSIRDSVTDILYSWKGEKSRDRLSKILGKERVKDILKLIED